MKFCIANTSYWESIGYNPIHWRKSINGAKALCHLQFAKVLSGEDIEDDDSITIFDIQDE